MRRARRGRGGEEDALDHRDPSAHLESRERWEKLGCLDGWYEKTSFYYFLLLSLSLSLSLSLFFIDQSLYFRLISYPSIEWSFGKIILLSLLCTNDCVLFNLVCSVIKCVFFFSFFLCC